MWAAFNYSSNSEGLLVADGDLVLSLIVDPEAKVPILLDK